MTDRTVDLFAGVGWDFAAQSLGFRPIGIEIDEWACATRSATDLLTIRADVTTLDPPSFGGVDGLIASPVCKDFSIAGNRAGIDGPNGRLMWEVPRWVEALLPRWVACEQVPPALEWWRIFAHRFRALGYRTWTGLLCAADYGTPQSRARAFLLAHRDRQPTPPAPTHAERPHPALFGRSLLPWVSMAEALGWTWTRPDGRTRSADSGSPAPTVCGNRKPAWIRNDAVLNTRRDQRADGSTQTIPVSAPAPTVTSVPGQWIFERTTDDAVAVTLPELGVLQDFPRDHPWQGNKTQVAEQIGNAVPIRLARAVLGSVAA